MYVAIARFVPAVAFFAVIGLVIGGASAGDKAAGVKLDVVTLKELQQTLQAQKGKIVVMDLWADFCIPCKREFPHLVELQKKYGKDGVVAVSLSLDPLADKAKAQKFLEHQKAEFPNFLLNEKAQVWQEHFDIYGPPAVMVYGTDGKLAGRFDNNDTKKQFTYADVEGLVQKLLAKAK